MRTSDFDYHLPEELIAQHPPEKRGSSRMLVLDPVSGKREILPFAAFPEFLEKDDAIVVNNTRVIKARLFARKDTGATIEILLLSPAPEGANTWNCLLKPAKRVSIGTVLTLLEKDAVTPGEEKIELIYKDPAGNCRIRFFTEDVTSALERYGHVPLPPYIKRTADYAPDSERYQTVYASIPGAVAAPTAGLHFTDDVLAALKAKGVKKGELTLHVGQGTFQPVSVEEIEEHPMHSEHYLLGDICAEMLNSTRGQGKRICACGTTSLRALETNFREHGSFVEEEKDTSIFLYPPQKITSSQMLLTNFHLPKSTLLMLVAAFAGYECIMDTYKFAVAEKMRFFSYGDCMLVRNHIF